MKRLLPVLAAAMLAAAPAFAATLEDVLAISSKYYAFDTSLDDAISQLATEGENPANSDKVRCAALARRAGILIDSGQTTEAAQDVDAAIALNPKSTLAFKAKAFVYAANKDFNDAIEAIDIAIANQKESPFPDKSVIADLDNLRTTFSLAAQPLTAARFQQEFHDDLFAAEKKYKNRIVCIAGKILSIGTSSEGKPELLLDAGDRRMLRVALPDSRDESKAARLEKGEIVMVFAQLNAGREDVTDMMGALPPENWYKESPDAPREFFFAADRTS